MLDRSILLLVIAGISYLLSHILYSFEIEKFCFSHGYRTFEKISKIVREALELITITLYFPSAIFAIYIFIFK